MIDPASVPPVAADELLARFVLQRSHVRSDRTVKPDAFLPPPNLELSVIRHRSAEPAELWAVGRAVAAKRQRTLYGRADVQTSVLLEHRLSVVADAIEGNPNHANVSGWPADKAAQKNIAQEVAAVADFVPTPDAVNADAAP